MESVKGSASMRDAAQSRSVDMFEACRTKNFDLMDTQNLTQMGRLAAETDSNGNTLLHALFQTCDSSNGRDCDPDKFAATVLKLVNSGVDASRENASLRNCLLGTDLEQSSLQRVLQRLAGSDLKPIFARLQTNSEGLHAVHVLACRYELDKLIGELSQICDLSPTELVRLRVTSGDLCGATCLHLACRAGHEENIRFLLGQGGDLAVETAAGETCVDLACSSGELQALLTAAESVGMDLKDLLTLVDPPERALPLPSRSTALSRLSLFNGPALIDRGNSDEGKSENELNLSKSIQRRSAQMRWLLRALELDSAEILRDLIASEFVKADLNPPVISNLQILLLTTGKPFEQFLTNEIIRPILINHPKVSLIDFAVFFSRTNLLPELLMLPQFDIIPKTLHLLIQLRLKIKLRQGKQEQLLGARTQALNVLINVLEQLYSNASERDRQLLFGYLTASFVDSDGVRGPLFLNPQCLSTGGQRPADCVEFVSVMELVDIVDSVELFGTECLSKLVSHYWKLPSSLPWRPEADDADFSQTRWLGGEQNASRCQSTRGCTARVKFSLVSAYLFLFLGFFAWYLLDFGRTLAHRETDVVLFLCALSQTLQWFNKLTTICEWREVFFSTSRCVCRTFTHGLTYVDLIAVVLLWTGLLLKLIGQHRHDVEVLSACQGVLGMSFLFCTFRLVSLYNYFRVTGAKISMFLSLLYKDFWPFFNFAFFIIIAFGVFYATLNFPIVSSSVTRELKPVFKHIFVVPLHLMFGDFGKTEFDECNDTRLAGNFDCAAPTGNLAFSKYLVFLFLLVVNLVLVNLLIALFSMRVAVMDVKCVAIWRRNRYRMLLEYATVSPLPPPLSCLHYIGLLLWRARRCLRQRNKVATSKSGNQQPWWQKRDSFSDYPSDYRAYLTFQARQLRLCRPKLRLGVERNRSDFAALGAFFEAELDKAREDLTKEADDRQKRLQRELEEQGQQLHLILELLNKHAK